MPFIAAIIPTLGVSFLFWLAIRAMLQADARERVALARSDKAAGAETAARSEEAAPTSEN